MIVVGITGNFGSGKTTVARMFAEHGAVIVDADKIAHMLIQPDGICAKAVVKHFGKSILRESVIDRKKLAYLVFGDEAKLKALCAIVHPVLIRQIKKAIAYQKNKKRKQIIAVDMAILFEVGLDSLMDVVVVVKANKEKQIERIRKRTGMARREILQRIAAQIPSQDKIRLADIIIDNRKTVQETGKQVNAVWNKLKRLNINN